MNHIDTLITAMQTKDLNPDTLIAYAVSTILLSKYSITTRSQPIEEKVEAICKTQGVDLKSTSQYIEVMDLLSSLNNLDNLKQMNL